MYNIFNENNMNFSIDQKFNLIYSDYIYQNLDFSWIDKYWNYLLPNSIFMAQTDDSTMSQLKYKLDSLPNSFFRNLGSICWTFV